MESYKPNPIDTKNVELPAELNSLVESLAKNTHDVWAKNRIADGWTYGKSRNDKKKTTPCLIPYETLPSAEKKYDREMVTETLKVIYKLGYKIEKI